MVLTARVGSRHCQGLQKHGFSKGFAGDAGLQVFRAPTWRTNWVTVSVNAHVKHISPPQHSLFKKDIVSSATG